MSAETLNALADRCEVEGPSTALDADISAELDLWSEVGGVVHPYIWTTSEKFAELALPPGHYALIKPPDDGTLYGRAVFAAAAGDDAPPVSLGKSGRTPSNALLAAAFRARAALLA